MKKILIRTIRFQQQRLLLFQHLQKRQQLSKRGLSSARPSALIEDIHNDRALYSAVMAVESMEMSPSIETDTVAAAADVTTLRDNEIHRCSSASATTAIHNLLFVQNDDSSTPSTQTHTLSYTQCMEIPITSQLHIVTPEENTPCGIWPVFRLMDENGNFYRQSSYMQSKSHSNASSAPLQQPAGNDHLSTPLPPRNDVAALRKYWSDRFPEHVEHFSESKLMQPSEESIFANINIEETKSSIISSRYNLGRAFKLMIQLQEMDHILLHAQRQGRISFYMTCRGEEAIHMGAASALHGQDPILAQYREQGMLMWRGFTLEQFTNQCFSTDLDLGKGRQMPIHYGSRALAYQTISSPLGTQMPQAVGVACRLKLAGRSQVTACFFGEGCASTVDFHSALNFAATLRTPVLFFCRNNGYAISTPTADQYHGDGIISRAPGYGMAAIRVDGNDLWAVHETVREARRYALHHSAPVLIEAMTYRLGHHSTSDDSMRYRPVEEVNDVANSFDPIKRVSKCLQQLQWLTIDEENVIRDRAKVAILKAIEQTERRLLPSFDSMFDDVYKDMPRHLLEQKEQMHQHVAKYPKQYTQHLHRTSSPSNRTPKQ